MTLAALLAVGCGDTSGPSAARGLVPGTFTVRFEVAPTVATPVDLQGRHDFTFRVSPPAETPGDVAIVSSRRLPPDDGPAVFDYLRIDPDLLVIEPGRWQIRLPYVEGEFAVSVTLREASNGGISTGAGCYGRAGATASYLGSGCVIERQ